VKRYLFTVVPVAVVLTAAVAFLRSQPHLDAETPIIPAAVKAADVPIPIQFRQNQPRHWRYIVLSQSR
jgi:hypothetical protein